MFYILLRWILIPVALIGWIVYQALVKKKKWAQLKNDASVTVFVMLVWSLLYFVLLR